MEDIVKVFRDFLVKLLSSLSRRAAIVKSASKGSRRSEVRCCWWALNFLQLVPCFHQGGNTWRSKSSARNSSWTHTLSLWCLNPAVVCPPGVTTNSSHGVFYLSLKLFHCVSLCFVWVCLPLFTNWYDIIRKKKAINRLFKLGEGHGSERFSLNY